MSPFTKAAILIIGTASVAVAAPVAHGGQKFSTALTAQAERPHLGDVNASGFANIIINPGQQRICWEITTAGVDAGYTIIGAHIHRAPPTSAGPIVVHVAATANATNANCTTASRALIDEIRKNPANFYVNVHWMDTTAPITLPSFAAGAIRGQLAKNQLM